MTVLHYSTMFNKRPERLSDGVAVRITTNQRQFLETLSAENKLSMGESVRLLIDEAMGKTGVEV